MSKMCGLSKKLLGKKTKEYAEYLDNPKYFCANCGRVANDKKNLCNPEKIDKYLDLVKK